MHPFVPDGGVIQGAIKESVQQLQHLEFAKDLRRTIEAHPVEEMRTSASCGVATMLPDDSVEALLGAADQGLYQAKSNGRNRTESVVRSSSHAAD